VIALAHGGPMEAPDDVRYVLENTSAQGFVGASSIERLPVETAIAGTVRAFKNISLPNNINRWGLRQDQVKSAGRTHEV
jgi:predicted TIM-barrel enzyme